MPADDSTAKSLSHVASQIADPTERAAFLSRECGDDAEFRARVDSLLQSTDAGAGTCAFEAADDRDDPALLLGSLLAGKYRLVEVIGEGGMGQVFMARQTEPVQRDVAVKVIKTGMDSRAILARFEAERQALAIMDHPNIAKVLDAGTTEIGQPYFVMELVDGMPITKFCDERRLTPRQRLELFVPVCQAIQHAHQKGVIHRDIKPSNVLVTMYDDRPVPKVIDFGVAKATGRSLTDMSLMTGIDTIVGTPEYMSPEQANAENTDIDTRSDVYSLGVLLYELLTGTTPVDRKSLGRAAVFEILRIVREVEAPRPSAKLSTIEALPSVAANRSIEPAKLSRLMKGELDWVVLKALEKDRKRRYETANGLARDIQRYLADEPVEARPPSAGYRLKKFVRRNRAAVTAGTVVAAALLVATGVSVWFGISESRQRAEADRLRGISESTAEAEAKARKRAEATTKFVTKALDSSDPMQRGRQDTTIAQAMAGAIAEIDAGAFRDNPETEAALKDTIGLILKNNANYAKARPLLEQALASRERLFPGDHPETALSLNNLASLFVVVGEYDKSEQLQKRALAMFEKTRGPQHADVAASLSALAALFYLQGRKDESETYFKRALTMREALLGPNHRDLALTLNDMGLLYSSQDRYAEAEPLMKRSLEINEKALGPNHPDVAASLNSLANLYDDQRQFARAEPFYARALSICEKSLGPEHPIVATALHSLAENWRAQQQYERAGPLYRRALAIREKVFGPDHSDVAIVLNNLALLLKAQGRLVEAEPLYLRTLAIDEKLHGPNHPEVGQDLHNLAAFYEVRNQTAKAEEFYKRSLAIREKALGPDHLEVAKTLNNLALLYGSQKQHAQAEEFARRAAASYRKAKGPNHPEYAQILSTLGRVQYGAGKTADGRQTFDECLAILRGKPEGSPALARILWRSASARIDSGIPAELPSALRELEEGFAMAQKLLPPGHPHLKEYTNALSKCKAAIAKPAEK